MIEKSIYLSSVTGKKKKKKLTNSRTMVRPYRRPTSIPIGLGAGFARAPTMAMEAMRKKLVCMVDDLDSFLEVLEEWTRLCM